MPLRRVIVALTVLAAACAPAPDLDDSSEPRPSTPISTITTTTPTDAPGARDGAVPVSVPGRIVTHTDTASIRTGDREIRLDTGDLPGQPTWSRDGSRVAVMSLRGRLPVVDVFDGTTGRSMHRVSAERPYFFFSWSHDGTRIAALGPGPAGTALDILDAGGELVHADVAEAGSVFVAWEPGGQRLVAHVDDSLLRVDADGSVTDLGLVGSDFFAPKWIPGSADILLVVDLEGTSTLVRRGVEGGDPLTTLGSVETQTGIAVDPDGRLAAISMTFDVTPSGGAEVTGRRARSGPLTQTVGPQTGTVEIIDLRTGERVLVLEGLARWTEWSPDGSRLLISTLDGATSTTTWWIYERAPLEETAEVYAVTSAVATPVFANAYLLFADQYIEQPRLWSPTGATFVYPELTLDGPVIRIAAAEEGAEPGFVGPGDVGFWSPSG